MMGGNLAQERMALTGKTLDAAKDDFRDTPTRENAAVLLTVATTYWNDEMIGDESYADKVRLVRDWLLEMLGPVDCDPEGPIADAARRIASYADGRARTNIYRAATAELKRRDEDGHVFDAPDELSDAHRSIWGEHPDHPVATWADEVAAGDTRAGYWPWISARLEAG